MSLQNRVTLGTKFGLQLKLLQPNFSALNVDSTTADAAPANSVGQFGISNHTLVNSTADKRDFNDAYVRFTNTRSPLWETVVPVVDYDNANGVVYLQWEPKPGPVHTNDTFEIWKRYDPSGLPDLVNRGLQRCREVTEIILMDTQDVYQGNAYSLPIAGLKKTLLRIPSSTQNLLTEEQADCTSTDDFNALQSATLATQTLPVLDGSGSITYNFHDVQDVDHAIAVTTPGTAAGEGIETDYIQLNPIDLGTLDIDTPTVDTVTGTVGLAGTGTVVVELSVYDRHKNLLQTVTAPSYGITTRSYGQSGDVYGGSQPYAGQSYGYPINLAGSSYGWNGGTWYWITVPNVSKPGMCYAKLRVLTTTESAGTFYVSAPQVEPNASATPWVPGGSKRVNPQIESQTCIRDYWISRTGDPDNRQAILQAYTRMTENGHVEIRWGDDKIHSGRVITLMTRTRYPDLEDDATSVNISPEYAIAAMAVEFYLSESDHREGGARGDVERQYARWITEFNRQHKHNAPLKGVRRRLLT